MRLTPLVGLAALGAALLPAVPASATPTTAHWRASAHGATVAVRQTKPSGPPTTITPVDRSSRPLATGTKSLQRPHVISGTQLSTWDVTYDTAFQANTAAMAAFDAAVKVWEHTVYSPVHITVSAKLATSADPSLLGAAGPHTFFQPDSTQPYYPAALANALSGTDQDPGNVDIDAEFYDNASTFDYDTGTTDIKTKVCDDPFSGTPTAGACIDFESVVLHELAHGLGFIGSTQEDYDSTDTDLGTATYGIDPFGAVPDTTPFIFDEFTETANGQAVLDYENTSAELSSALHGNDLFWFGSEGAAADRGREPQLYAPNIDEPGSTYSHLDDTVYPAGDPDELMTPYAEAGNITRDPGEVTLGMFRDMGWLTPGLPGTRFTALTPTRVLDTKSTKIANGKTVDIRLGGKFGVPATATAVVLNIAAAGPTTPSTVTAYPLGRSNVAPIPFVANLNTSANDTRSNLTTVPISFLGSPGNTRTGLVRLLNKGGAARLVADLAGYYAPSGTTLFHPVAPSRVLDTRSPAIGTYAHRIGAGGYVDLAIPGIPADATAVTLTLAASNPTKPTYISVFPTGTAQTTANLNLQAGAVAANSVVVKFGAGHKIRLQNYTGSVDLIADLAGWYGTETSGGTRYRPTQPQRILDSRDGTGPLGPGETRDVPLADEFYGVPAAAQAVILNVAGVTASIRTHLTAFPPPTAPNASTVNFSAGQTASSNATVQLGTVNDGSRDVGGVRIQNASGTIGLVVDLQGWFGP